MGEQWPDPLSSQEAGGRPKPGPDDGGSPDLQSNLYEGQRLKEPRSSSDPYGGKPGAEDEEEEIPPEEMGGEEPEAGAELAQGLQPGLEDDIPEMSQLTISQQTPSPASSKGRSRRRQRLLELAKPKTNWQTLRDRRGCGLAGFAWIAPRQTSLQFCVFWPSVYWTERFVEDTTLTITVPAVSRRVEELARPRRFYLEYYNNNRTTPIWPIPRSTLDYQASHRLKQLAVPKVRNNIWNINMSEVSQVSRAAQMAVPSSRILQLAKPRAPAPLLEEWDPMPKAKPHASDHNRLLQLAMPKAQSDKCVLDRDPRWEVLEVTKKAVASPRIVALAQPRVRKNLNEGYNPYYISPASLVAQASPRLYELATPKSVTKKV